MRGEPHPGEEGKKTENTQLGRLEERETEDMIEGGKRLSQKKKEGMRKRKGRKKRKEKVKRQSSRGGKKEQRDKVTDIFYSR